MDNYMHQNAIKKNGFDSNKQANKNIKIYYL